VTLACDRSGICVATPVFRTVDSTSVADIAQMSQVSTTTWDVAAHVLPVQTAGLRTYQRPLDG